MRSGHLYVVSLKNSLALRYVSQSSRPAATLALKLPPAPFMPCDDEYARGGLWRRRRPICSPTAIFEFDSDSDSDFVLMTG